MTDDKLLLLGPILTFSAMIVMLRRSGKTMPRGQRIIAMVLAVLSAVLFVATALKPFWPKHA